MSETFYSKDEEYENSHTSNSLEESYSETSLTSSTLATRGESNLCRRLHYCIHDALSKIKAVHSTTQRLKVLKQFIPEDPILPLQGKQLNMIQLCTILFCRS